MRYLAIDYGTKRTGLAICDPTELIASPLEVIKDRNDLPEYIAKVALQEQVEAIVVGLPLNMDDTEGPQAKRVRDFATLLSQRTPLEILFHDERLSSFDAESKMAAHYTRKQKKNRLDAVAAASILQSFIDVKNGR